MITKSTKAGWIKIGRRHYRHESKVEVRKGDRGWEVIGGADDGNAYGTMWVAMMSGAGTPAEWVR